MGRPATVQALTITESCIAMSPGLASAEAHSTFWPTAVAKVMRTPTDRCIEHSVPAFRFTAYHASFTGLRSTPAFMPFCVMGPV